jgi:hypothetical protein
MAYRTAMILTPVHHDAAVGLLDEFGRSLDSESLPRQVLDRIAAYVPEGDLMRLSEDPAHHRQALGLCRKFGIAMDERSPAEGLTWDGLRVALRMEPSLIIHEVAHYQCAAPQRRMLPDFGLGAGPESGNKRRGEECRQVFGTDADIEEALASLLGILWEAELGQPAILAFLEQNWLEGGAKPQNLAHFQRIVSMLVRLGLIDATGRPTMALREMPDEQV